MLPYLNARDIVAVDVDTVAPRGPYVSGYGDRVPTRFRVVLSDGRARRVYAACYGNAASLYVTVAGVRRYLDPDGESAVEAARDGRPRPELYSGGAEPARLTVWRSVRGADVPDGAVVLSAGRAMHVHRRPDGTAVMHVAYFRPDPRDVARLDPRQPYRIRVTAHDGAPVLGGLACPHA